jgi:hypothetical protein
VTKSSHKYLQSKTRHLYQFDENIYGTFVEIELARNSTAFFVSEVLQELSRKPCHDKDFSDAIYGIEADGRWCKVDLKKC